MRENYRAWEIEPIHDFVISKEELYTHLVGWAILAPSTHNAQPWKFLIDTKKNSIKITLDRDYVLPVSDPVGRQSFISLGCAFENLIMAAKYYGLNYLTEYQDDSISAWISDEPLSPCNASQGLSAMKNRRINRGQFDSSRKLPDKFEMDIKILAQAYGLRADLIIDTVTRFAIAEFQYLADRYVIAKTDFRNELAEYFLPNDTNSGRGMPGNTFKLNDNASLKIHELLKTKGSFDPNLAAGLAITNRDAVKSSPLIAVLSVPEDSSLWWMKAGQTLERIAILCEVNGLSFAINAALVEARMFNKMLKMRLGLKERPTVLMRMGYATESMPHSPRASARSVTEINNAY